MSMLVLGHRNQKFSNTMEILCMLPKWPNFITMTSLIDELRVGSKRDAAVQNARDLRNHFYGLKRMGIEVIVDRYDGKRICGIDPKSWNKAKEIGQIYWDQVYG